MKKALAYFHELRVVFIEIGVRPNSVALPRNHSLLHYVDSIRLFGSSNGLCSSITESKHIEAVKDTWHRSNRNEPIEQMLRSLTRKNKLSSARIEFGRQGMLHNHVLTAARLEVGDDDAIDTQAETDMAFFEAREEQDDDGVTYNSVCNFEGILAMTVANLPTMWGKPGSEWRPQAPS